MKNQVIHLNIDEADLFASDYFINICGFHREGEKYKRLLAHGMQIKGRIIDKIDLQAVVSSFDRDIISGNTAQIGEVAFVCNAFQQINRDSIQKVYLYIFTSGDFELNDDDSIIDQLYADIWGTAYTDAGLEVLKNYLMDDFNKNNSKSEATVMDPFGPGFYGMDVDQVGKFFEVLDGGKIGVKARTNSLMVPLKSCAGFFVVVDDGTALPAADCKSCHADHKGCEYCQAVIKRNK
ncbi:MAG TPA: hypothetical protein VM577_14335 [Anaerovoracaceae bacterium]|nr:hypothetical protein [Anaerovoracaceae bacterium]